MASVEVEMDEGGSLARIDGRSYRWSIDGGVLTVRNPEGEDLSPTSARVLMSLGGAEPPWFQVVEAIFEAFRTSITGGEAGVRAAVDALERSKTRRAELARITRDRSALTALAVVGTTQVGANPLCDPHAWQLIMSNPDADVRRLALRNNDVLPATLWEFPDEETRIRVARNPDCPDSILAKLALLEAPVRSAVASNVHVSPDLLAKLRYLLPPLTRTSELYGAFVKGTDMPWHLVEWFLAYGAICFALGLYVLHRRRLAGS